MLPRVVLRLEWGLFRLDRDEGRACSRPSPKPARFTAICDLAEEAAAPAPVGVTEGIAALLRGHGKPPQDCYLPASEHQNLVRLQRIGKDNR